MIVQGNKINLRDMQLQDVETYIHWQQPGHEWQKLDGPYYPYAAPEADFAEKTRQRIQAAAWPQPRTRLIIADGQTDQLLGIVTRYWIGEETNWLAIGIVIYDRVHWGKGIGYEALGLWSDYLFQHMTKIVRLDLRTWSGNVGMMKLAQKLGYQEEARFRMARIVEGQYYDGMGYGILRSEWESTHPSGFSG